VPDPERLLCLVGGEDRSAGRANRGLSARRPPNSAEAAIRTGQPVRSTKGATGQD